MAEVVDQELVPWLPRHEVSAPPPEHLMGPDEQVRVDLDASLATSRQLHGRLGIEGNLVATVTAASKSFLIIDTRRVAANRNDFLVADETYSESRRVGFAGFSENEVVVVGRQHLTDRFVYPRVVSRDHFELLYINGGLFIRNLHPTNETKVTGYLAPLMPQYGVLDARTEDVVDRMQAHVNFGEKDEVAPYGYYMDHPILGRLSQSVMGGVYLGGGAREAIVVDSKSGIMQQAYGGLASELRQSFDRNMTLPLRSVLLAVMHRVQTVMPYDGAKAEEIGDQYRGDRLVGLSTFVQARAGVCRHQGLLAAYFIERLIHDGYLRGSIGIERNTVEELGGTHAWAAYKTEEHGRGRVIVVDPAQRFVGSKEQARREGRWEYYLSTDEY